MLTDCMNEMMAHRGRFGKLAGPETGSRTPHFRRKPAFVAPHSPVTLAPLPLWPGF